MAKFGLQECVYLFNLWVRACYSAFDICLSHPIFFFISKCVHTVLGVLALMFVCCFSLQTFQYEKKKRLIPSRYQISGALLGVSPWCYQSKPNISTMFDL